MESHCLLLSFRLSSCHVDFNVAKEEKVFEDQHIHEIVVSKELHLVTEILLIYIWAVLT